MTKINVSTHTPICELPPVLFRGIFDEVLAATNCQNVELYIKLKNSSLEELSTHISIEPYKEIIEEGLAKRYVKGDFTIGDSLYFHFESKKTKELTFKKRLNHQYSIELIEDDDYSFEVLLHFSTNFTPKMEFNKVTQEISAPIGDVITHKPLGCDTASFAVGMKKTYFYSVKTLSDGYYADVFSTKKSKEHMIIFSIAHDALTPSEFMNGLRATLETQTF